MQDEQPGVVERRGTRTRKRVLEAALAVVRERPLAEVQLQHIAARAGISPGHVLYHFGSKDQILVEALQWSEDSIASKRARELREIDDPALRLTRWIVLYLPREAEDPTWKLWLELWLRSAMDDDLRRIPAAIAESWRRDFDEIIDDGIERNMFAPADREDFAKWAHNLLVGLSIGVLAGWHGLDDARRSALRSIGKELGCTLSEASVTATAGTRLGNASGGPSGPSNRRGVGPRRSRRT
jgi:AcrR family transcriptional regulator